MIRLTVKLSLKDRFILISSENAFRSTQVMCLYKKKTHLVCGSRGSRAGKRISGHAFGLRVRVPRPTPERERERERKNNYFQYKKYSESIETNYFN